MMTSPKAARGTSARGAAESVEDAAETLADHPWFEKIARAGYVMSGLVHVLIGWLALRIAIGGSGESADQSGALRAVAAAPGGNVLLWIGGVVLVALAVWHLLEAWFGARKAARQGKAAVHVLRAVGTAAVYGVLAATALRFAAGAGSDSGDQTSSITASLLGNPAGVVLVVVLGLVVAGIGGYHVYKGVSRSFEEDLRGTGSRTVGKAVVVTGVAGYVAKGVALGAVGVLFVWAGLGSDPERATGLDGALKSMAGLPAGVVLLVVVGAGLILYGVYSVLRSRYAVM